VRRQVRALVDIRRWSWETRVSTAAVSALTLLVALWLYLGIPMLWLPALAAASALTIFTLHQPVFGVLAVVAAQYLPIAVGQLTLFQLLGGMVTILCLIFYAVNRRGLVLSNMIPPILAFTLLALQSLSFTHDADLTQYLIRKLIFNALFCLLLVNVIDDLQKFRWLLWVVVGLGMINSLVATVQFWLGHARIEEFSGVFRAKGLLENENQLGEITALCLMVPLQLFLAGDRRWKRGAGLLICVLLSFGLVTSISRGAVLAVLAGLGYVALRASHHRRRLLVFAVLVAAAFPFLPEAFFARFRNLNQEMRGTVALSRRVGLTERGYFNKAGIRIWKAHPILGVGLGNYGFYYILPEFNPGRRGSTKLPPHNLYVQALAETGIVGFLVLCWWIFLAGLNYWNAERNWEGSRMDLAYIRACEALTIVALVMYFSGGAIMYTNFAMVLTLSYVCRRCAGRVQAAAALPGPAPGTVVPA